MIKLKFQLPKPVERAFDSSRVVIGLGSPDCAEIPFDATLQADHLVIEEVEGDFWATNQVNDPFATLNGRPFGRKVLRSGDRLIVADVAIAFEATLSVEKMLERKMSRLHSQYRLVSPAPLVTKQLSGHDSDEIVALLQEVEALEASRSLFEQIETPVKPEKQVAPSEPNPESMVAVPGVSSPAEPQRVRSWRRMALFASLGLMAFLALTIGILFAFEEQSDYLEFLAAQDVADVAMALTYAQVNQVKSPNQNWADPDFIRSNLERVLGGHFDSAVDLDAQGYLKSSPYLLRIYTNHDLSHFLLVAQPAPSLWHWFTKKQTILLDSTEMELRRTTDLRALNRLMAHPSALVGGNALEVSRLVREAPLIPLKQLARESGHWEYAPPRTLKEIYPGAENLVHNAPRYYRLGEPIVLQLAKMGLADPEEKRTINHQLDSLARLNHLVLYTAAGSDMATRAFEMVREYYPTVEVLIGYLMSDGEKGAFISSQLISQPERLPPSSSIHPVKNVLRALAMSRRDVLQPLSEQMMQLLHTQDRTPSDLFYDQMAQLLTQYHQLDALRHQEARITIDDLYQKHVKTRQLPTEEFISYVKEAGWEAFLPALEPAAAEGSAGAAEEQPLIPSDFQLQGERTGPQRPKAISGNRKNL